MCYKEKERNAEEYLNRKEVSDSTSYEEKEGNAGRTSEVFQSLIPPPEKNQPASFNFPRHTFGKTSQTTKSFLPDWFKTFPWVHYDESLDAAFCHTCMLAAKKLTCTRREDTFISTGFTNRKNARTRLRGHECSDCHKEAVKIFVRSKQATNISETFSMQLTQELNTSKNVGFEFN